MNKPRPAIEKLPYGGWRAPARSYEKQFSADYYAVPKEGGVNLNVASVPHVIEEVREDIEEAIKKWKKDGLSKRKKLEIGQEARQKAAEIMGIEKPAEIFFGRNTTEVISFSYWLSAQSTHDPDKASVLISDAENPSVYRANHVNLDSGNRDRKDKLTTYSDFSVDKTATYEAPDEWIRHSFDNIGVFRAYDGQSVDEMKRSISELLRGYDLNPPDLMILSHVLRHDGRAIPAGELADHARHMTFSDFSAFFACVDGAMAVGNLARINVEDLNCNMYAMSPHKTLGSPVLGIGWKRHMKWLSSGLRNRQKRDQIIMGNMFDPSLGIKGNVDEEINYAALFGFSRTVEFHDRLRGKVGNDFSEIAGKRELIKSYAKEQLSTLRNMGVPVEFLASENGTPMILSFRLFGDPGRNGLEQAYLPYNPYFPKFVRGSREKNIARKLDRRGIAVSFIRRGKIFRISFDWTTTKEDIDKFVGALKEILEQETHRNI